MATKRNTNNDSRILQLKKQIEEKKKGLARSEKFVPVTHCSLDLDSTGRAVNLHTCCSVNDLSLLAVEVNAFQQSAYELGLSPTIGGFSLQDWLTDLRAKIAVLDRQNEQNRLKALESKLHELLSPEKKTEILIDEMAGTLLSSRSFQEHPETSLDSDMCS
jgi:hypothetical protein